MKPYRIPAVLLLLALLLALAACGAPEPPAPTAAPVTTVPTAAPTAPEAPAAVEFTDDTGRTFSLPATVERIAVTGPMSQIVLFALAPDLLVGIPNEWDPGAEAYFDPAYYNLPVLGQLYGGKGELNLEELLAAAPQLVLDVGEPKGNIGGDLDELGSRTDIPFLHIDADTRSMGDTFRRLGALLGREAAAEELAAYYDGVLERADAVMDAVGDGRVKLLYLLGDKGLNVIAKGSYHAEIIDMLSDNQAAVDEPSSKGTGNETDMEQILLWDPDFIVFAHGSVADSVGDDPVWQELRAIRSGSYAETPFGPYNWMGFPPSVQRVPGILWLIQTLYPEQADFDLYAEISRYYELFYHCTLTEEQFARIVG